MLSTIKKKPLFLNLSDFKIIYEILDSFGSTTQEEKELKAKVITIISYIERARLRNGGQS